MLNACDICGTSRYKEGDGKIASKQMRYFPLKPRLQKLFMSSHTSSLMRWHAKGRVDDGKFRHPTNSFAWKDFDKKKIAFASDCCNVRLGLATDGFSPSTMMNVSHSTWPVILIPYNLPPWACMKKGNFLLSILFDGPKGPGNMINVYLQLLIEELKELWEDGVESYDVSKNEMFILKVALTWTISDLPGYSILSGWGTKIDKGCPCCGMQMMCRRLEIAHKYSYTYHHRFLNSSHRFRRDPGSYDGKTKDNLNARHELAKLGVRKLLHEFKRPSGMVIAI
ncbi:UNVERIFIED_CONTAM: hypothetical protein Sradi_4882400 [Sesamum radiatum]|uniref:Transposase n=1 Tax=Sesamum radiatum TaxID=300843 RepID=A0AAW2MYV3_SESRA